MTKRRLNSVYTALTAYNQQMEAVQHSGIWPPSARARAHTHTSWHISWRNRIEVLWIEVLHLVHQFVANYSKAKYTKFTIENILRLNVQNVQHDKCATRKYKPDRAQHSVKSHVSVRSRCWIELLHWPGKISCICFCGRGAESVLSRFITSCAL